MQISYESAIQRLAEKTVDNTRELAKTRKQRRTEFADLYGIPFTAQGDATTPAEFYISISPDLVYYLRFQFKLHIQPFVSTVSGGTGSANVTVNDRSLSIANNAITPNPHNHSTVSHSHNIISGLTLTHTTADDFRVKIHGVDVTPYLMEQQDGEWIDGEGLYPSKGLDDDSVYDILDVATVLHSEGDEESVDKLLKPEFKRVAITSNAPFQATMYLYLKYSNMGR